VKYSNTVANQTPVNRVAGLFALWFAAALVACSVNAVTFRALPGTIGGTVTGLEGTGLVLTNNGGDDLPIGGDGAFAFMAPLERGVGYAVAVKSQPSSPTQSCTVSNASGTAGDGSVTDVQVSCTTARFSVGGTVTGLLGAGLVLRNGTGDTVAVSADGDFTFATPVASGASYSVTVMTQPSLPTQACAVAGGAGTVGASNVSSVAVTCTTRRFAIGGTVTGLVGAGLVLRNNGGDDLAISGDGSFAFATPIASGATFDVTVLTQPSRPTQTCTVAGGTGTVGGGDVTSVAINCATNRYMIGGTISGLAGTVTLQNNGGDDLAVTSNGSFAFSTSLPSGSTYSVTVKTQPATPSQTCAVASGAGTVGNANITSVAITCTTNVYTIGGMVAGLAAGDSITLRNNGGDALVRSANGSFTFATPVASGQPYAVTVTSPTAPISQTCTVATGAGTVGGSDVTNVAVTCATNTFTIGGTVSGLTGTGLVLQDNGGGNLTIPGNGGFTFTVPVASGATYNVTIATQPSGVACVVSAGTGTVGSANVTSVVVSCGCGDGILEAGEERDPPPGPFSSVSVDPATCRWHFENVAQLYCNGGCSWGGVSDCDQVDADIFCKLRTGNPNSTATTFVITTAQPVPGFPCLGSTPNVGPLPLRGVTVNVPYQDSSILANHGPGHVIVSPTCTNP